jgi:crotonobetainyl-CoA:carnitine CoA-transferase CaiB-like acyl-CoA transferase
MDPGSPGDGAALAGVRVLDLSRVLAGPWATQMLADFGAEVVKVERPGEGDDTRQWGPPFVGGADGSSRESAYFLCANRGKRSICVDFSTPEGARIVRDLAARADVLVENLKVGALARYGLDYASLSETNPRLVYCSLTGFGQQGPWADRAGYDFLIQGMAGLMSITGEADGRPLKAGVALADVITGLYACNAILAALNSRHRTGRGQQIDLSLLDSMIAALANQAMNFLATGVNPGRLGNAHPSIVPYDVFSTGDRPIIIAVGNDSQFRRLCEVLACPQWAADSRFSSNRQRVANRDELTSMMTAALQAKPSSHWIERLTAVGVPAGPISPMSDVFANPQVKHRGLQLSLPHPTLGAVPGVACPVKFSDTPVTYTRAPPVLGEGTSEILRAELGLTEAQLDDLSTRGIVG